MPTTYGSLPGFLRGFLCAVVALGLLTAGSCSQTDIGVPCSVPRTGPDANLPGCTAEATAAEAPQCFHPDLSSRDKDYVSFGATECDNLTCVRARCDLPADAPDRVNACASREPTSDPTGVCSGECITDTDCRPAKGVTGTFACRSLVLDDALLADLRKNLSDAEYQKYFGRVQSSKFCAKVGE